MSRKSELIREIDRAFAFERTGSALTRLWKKSTLMIVVNDLVSLGIAPLSLFHINAEHARGLITYWQKQELQDKTILNRLSVVRQFLRKKKNLIPPNANLPLPCPAKKELKKVFFSTDLIEKPEHSFSRSILAFQLYFGLTKAESMRIDLGVSIDQKSLLIARSLAYNGKDRCIPILTSEQHQAIQVREALVGQKSRLIDICPESDLRALFKADLMIKQMDPNAPFRAYYLQHRLSALLQSMDENSAWSIIQSEMGASSRYKLEKWL
jgi:Phage integrase, N-terminal